MSLIFLYRLCSALLIAATSPALAGDHGRAVSVNPLPQHFFGMHFHHVESWPQARVDSIRIADGTSWATIERSRGVFNWSSLDPWLELASGHNVEIIFPMNRTPQWASSSPTLNCVDGPGQCAPPKEMGDWERFITAIAKHSDGKIKGWEIWNEPGDPGYWSGDIATLVEMTKRAGAILKAIDPNAVVISPSPGYFGRSHSPADWMRRFLSAGGGAYVDVLAFHGYGHSAPKSEDILSTIDELRRVAGSSAAKNKPIWDTEVGWGKNQNLPDEEQRAAFLAKTFLLQWSAGVQRVYWYAWDNSEWGTLRGRRGAVAFERLRAWLAGSTLLKPCGQDQGSYWSCALQLADGRRAQIVWSDSTQEIGPIAGFSVAEDLFGNSSSTLSRFRVATMPVLLKQAPSANKRRIIR